MNVSAPTWLETTFSGKPDTRLSTYLKHQLGLSTTLLRKLKQSQAILVNGRPAKTNYYLQPGDRLQILAIDEKPGLPGENIPLNIIYEDDYLLVVNKPAGMVTHPVKHYTSGTLANALAFYFTQGPVSRRVRLVHRLDKDTSGLVLVSANPIIHNRLVRDLKTKAIRRLYWALVEGELSGSGTIDAPIDRETPGSSRHIVTPEGKPSLTHYRVLKTWSSRASLVELELETGRTHQIRVHMAHIGHPLLGDYIYGDPKGKGPINRQALHAKKLIFTHPVSGEKLELEVPLPEDMDRLVKLYDRYAELGL